MFSSPTAWGDLYGPSPANNKSDGPTRGSFQPSPAPPHIPHSDEGLRAPSEQRWISATPEMGTADPFTHASHIRQNDGVDHSREAAWQYTRQQGYPLYSSLSNDPFVVASQPVRVFPALPPLPPSRPHLPSHATPAAPRYGADAVSAYAAPAMQECMEYKNQCSPHLCLSKQPDGLDVNAESSRADWQAYGSPVTEERVYGPRSFPPSYPDGTDQCGWQRGMASNAEVVSAPWNAAQEGGRASEAISAAYPTNVYPQEQRFVPLDNSSHLTPEVAPERHATSNSIRDRFHWSTHKAEAGEPNAGSTNFGYPHHVPSTNIEQMHAAVPAPATSDNVYHNSDFTTPHRAPRLNLASPTTPASLSISDGAHHLNSVPHRTAAAASAVHLLYASGPSPSPGVRGGAGGFARHERTPCGSEDISHSEIQAERTPYGRKGKSMQMLLRSPSSSSTRTGAISISGNAATASATSAAAAVTPSESCCVAAVIFNNAKEVGVALCELPSLTISLLQYADTAAFFKTTSLLHSRNPVEVLVPSTVVETELVQTLLRQHGSYMTLTSVQRCFYNTEAGVQRLSQLKSSEEAALCIEDTDRYLCVAAANALVLYMEHVNDMQLLPGSVRVRAEALEHFMEVSRTTARALQIIADGLISHGSSGLNGSSGSVGVLSMSISSASSVPPQGLRSSSTSQRRPRATRAGPPSSATAPAAAAAASYSSGFAPVDPYRARAALPTLRAQALVDVMPRACTLMGQRYLRRTLLQPLRDRVAVQGRHDSVAWLLADPRRVHVLRGVLRATAALDLERLTATLTLQPCRAMTEAQTQSYLESLLLLWSALPRLEQLHTQLRSYLGPPPTDVASSPVPSSLGEATLSSSSSCSLPVERGDGHTDEKGEASSTSDVQVGSAAKSTSTFPLVLDSVATTLQQCRFGDLNALMSRYLERSVLPAVVEHHERNSTRNGDLPSSRQESEQNFSVLASAAVQRTRTGVQPECLVAPRRSSAPRTSTSTLLRVLRMCFLVQAPAGGELDALRTRLSQRISSLTTYAAEMRQQWQIFSLRLEPDPVKLYCFSYLSSEAAKAQGVPFTWRYAGGSHFASYLAALREAHLQQQQRFGQQKKHVQQQRYNRRGRGGSGSEGDDDDGEWDGGGRVRGPRCDLGLAYDASSSSTSSTAMHFSHGDSRRQPRYFYENAPPSLPTSTLPGTHPVGLFPLHFVDPSNPQSTAQLDAQTSLEGRSRRRGHKRIRCGTAELEYGCARTQECVTAILHQQLCAVQPLVQSIRREFLGALQATVESVALLDTLLSFGLYSLTHHCTRPVLVEQRTGLTTAPEQLPWEASIAQTETGEMHIGASRNSDSEGACEMEMDEASGLASSAEDALAQALEASTATSLTSTTTATTTAVTQATTPTTATTTTFTSDGFEGSDGAPHDEMARRKLPYFVNGAFHPSAGVATSPERSAALRNRSAWPSAHAFAPSSLFSASTAHPQPTAAATAAGVARAARMTSSSSMPTTHDGVCLSWGVQGVVGIVTGPNACGKTTLLRILGQHITLAQAGCFVPARQAQLQLADRLFAHMLCDELPSMLHSSFKRELMELNELTHAATAESVALVDELGRSTTTAQGFSLAWATALFLCNRHVRTVLTSHFAGLPSLSRVRPACVLSYHFRVSFAQRTGDGWPRPQQEPQQQTQDERRDARTRSDVSSRILGEQPHHAVAPAGRRITIVRFGHELFPGPCPQRWYGLAMAERMHFFEPVLALARHTRDSCLQRCENGKAGDAERGLK